MFSLQARRDQEHAHNHTPKVKAVAVCNHKVKYFK